MISIRKRVAILIISVLLVNAFSCFKIQPCKELAKDFEFWKSFLDKTFDDIKPDEINYVIAEKMYCEHYKLDQLYELLKDYSGKNIGLQVIRSKLSIYKEQYEKAGDAIKEILSNYPCHPECLWLLKKNDELIENDQKIKSQPENEIDLLLQKVDLFLELRFPDKSLDILDNLIVKKSDPIIWLKIAQCLFYYGIIVNDNLPEDKEYLVQFELENDRIFDRKIYCDQVFFDIVGLVSNEYNDAFVTEPYMWLNPGAVTISMIKDYNFATEQYFVRKYISCIYVAKLDLGDKFLKLTKKIIDCDLDFELEDYYGTYPSLFLESKTMLPLIQTALILNKNYLNSKNWNGEYLTFWDDDSWGYDYIFVDDMQRKVFGVVCTGPNFKFDSMDGIGGDDIGFVMSYNDLEN